MQRKLSLFIFIIFIFIQLSSFAYVDFSNIPVAKNIEQSKKYLDDRRALINKYWLNQGISKFNSPVIGFYGPILIRLSLGIDTHLVNSAINNPNTFVYSDIGTDFDYAGPFCKRKGDYDFMLLGLTNIASHYWSSGLLYEETKRKLLDELLTAKGSNHHTTIDLGICGTHEETENHVLMTEVSRYLTNQLVVRTGNRDSTYDNEKNGFNVWMLNHLQKFLKRGFSEYNSKPYQGYSVMALQNLYDFARDQRVKLAAQMVLDFLSANFAVQNNNLRRITPFRRQNQYLNKDNVFEGDHESSRYAVLAGNIELFKIHDLPKHGVPITHASLTSYRIPDIILDMIIRKDRTKYLQSFKHEGVEIYYSSPNFLLSGGGIFVNKLDAGTGENDGLAVELTLIPTKSKGVNKSDFIRFNGIKRVDKLTNNMCVAPNFACGVDPIIPKNIPSQCQFKSGDWTFINLTKEHCDLDYGIYVALYEKKCKNVITATALDIKEFGFIEVAEASDIESFNEFVTRVYTNNESTIFSESGENIYTSSKGDEIKFTPLPISNKKYPIISFSGKEIFNNKFSEWKLASGDIINASGDGLVIIENKYFAKKLILDMREPLNPRRYEE